MSVYKMTWLEKQKKIILLFTINGLAKSDHFRRPGQYIIYILYKPTAASKPVLAQGIYWKLEDIRHHPWSGYPSITTLMC